MANQTGAPAYHDGPRSYLTVGLLSASRGRARERTGCRWTAKPRLNILHGTDPHRCGLVSSKMEVGAVVCNLPPVFPWDFFVHVSEPGSGRIKKKNS